MSLWLGVGLAVVAALAINASYLVQHAGLASLPPVRPGSLRGLLSSRRWLLGAALGYAGLAVDVAALSLAPLVIVQSIVSAGLVVVLAGARRATRMPPTTRERVAVGLTIAAVSMLALGAAQQRSAPAPLALAAFFAAAGALAGLLVAGAPSSRRLGAAAGVLYGATNVALVALLTAGLRSSAVGAVAVVGGALVTAGGFLVFQRGLQVGRPVIVVSAMSAATSVVAVAGGVLELGEGIGSTPALAALHVAAFVAVAVTAALAADEVSVPRGAVGVPRRTRRPEPPPRSRSAVLDPAE